MDPRARHRLVERFVRYCRIPTASDPDATTLPSTEVQKDLGRALVRELGELGLTDVRLDQWGYVYATLPGTAPAPVIGLVAHLDTSPDVPGAGVMPRLHRHYPGGEIVLGAPDAVIRPAEHPALADQLGNDIITSDGTTLLGADDKAGIAEIVSALEHLRDHPLIPRGTVKVAFTPDEETGRGTERFDVAGFGCRAAYTVDGETAGEIENETFCADTAVLTIRGVSVHPGFARDRLVNAAKLAAEVIAALPPDRLSPETTAGREGYLHPHQVQGGVETAVVKFLVRDFTLDGLHAHEAFLRELTGAVAARHPAARFDLRIEESYRNMCYRLDAVPEVVEYALDAVRRTGLVPRVNFLRGGTDGARLTFLGLPTPNIFTGGHSFHSRLEWISVQDMEKAVATIVNLVQVWAERAK